PKLEDRAALLRRQLLPEAQVGLVAAALDVVPDRRRRSVHRQNSFAKPRSASSLRSSISAVYVGRAKSRPPACATAASSERSIPGTTSIASSGQPAYFSRSAISGARVPEQTTRRTPPASSSRSA